MYEQLIKESSHCQIYKVIDDSGRKIIKRVIENGNENVFVLLRDNPHKGMPEIYSVSSENNKVTVTEEYIEGSPVSAGCVRENDMLRAMVQLCKVLIHIHSLGIIHRDIKPSNILISENGDISLIDFETARIVRPAADSDTRHLGTEGFAPPEQYGFSQTDMRSDIYALGKTFECVLGSLAFDKKYMAIIEKCTQFDPDKRYSDVNSVLADLNKGRHNIKLWAASVSVLLLCLGMAVYLSDRDTVDTALPVSETESAVAVSETEQTTTVFDPYEQYRYYYKDIDYDKAVRIDEEQMEKPLLLQAADHIPFEYIIIDAQSLMDNKYVTMLCDYDEDGNEDLFQISAYIPEGQNENFRTLCVSVVSMRDMGPDYHVISDNTYFTSIIQSNILNQETGMLKYGNYIQLSVLDIGNNGKEDVILSVGDPDDFLHTQVFLDDNTALEYSSSELLSMYMISGAPIYYDNERGLGIISDGEPVYELDSIYLLSLEGTIKMYRDVDINTKRYEMKEDPLYKIHSEIASKPGL